MKIQRKAGAIQITSGEVKVLLGHKLEANAEDFDLFIGTELNIKGVTKDKVLIDRPGEYESHGVMVQALPDLNSARIIVFSLDIEGVNLVFINSDVKIPPKKILEQIGINHVLIFNIVDGIEHVRELVDVFEPEYIIPITDKVESIEAIGKKLGLMLPEKQKNLVLTGDDLEGEDEEKPLNLVVLE
jgi:hypothetical protein